MHATTLAPVLLLPLLCPSPMQDRTPAGAPADTFVIEAGEHELIHLIERSGEFLGRTYHIDKTQNPAVCNPNDASSKISITRRLELDARGCEEVVGQLLFAKGWAAAPLDVERKVWDWVFLSGQRMHILKKRATRVSVEEVMARPRLVEYVLVPVRLQHGNAQIAVANLRPFYHDSRGINQMAALADAEQRTLWVAGFRPEVAAIVELLREADVPPTEPSGWEQRLGRIETVLQQTQARLKQLEAAKDK